MGSRDIDTSPVQRGRLERHHANGRTWLETELDRLGTEPAPDALRSLLSQARDRKLDEDAVPALADLRARLAAALMLEAVRHGRLPVVASLHPLPPGDRCHLITPARFGRRRSDQCGHLALTTGWLRFHGALDLSVAWGEVTTITRAGHEVSVALHDSRRLLRFHCPGVEEAAGAEVLATHLAGAARAAGAEPGRAGTPQPMR